MSRRRVRLGALALAVAGVFFVLYPAIRPYSDETSLQGAAAFASSAWIVAHVLAMLGFVLVALGLLAMYRTLRDTPAEGLAFLSLIATWIGAGLTLPYYGAEAFGLHAVGQEAIRQQSAAIMSLANDIRYGPGIVMFGAGLVLLGLGAILAAVAVWRSGEVAQVERGPVRARVRAVHPAILRQPGDSRDSWATDGRWVRVAGVWHLARPGITNRPPRTTGHHDREPGRMRESETKGPSAQRDAVGGA